MTAPNITRFLTYLKSTLDARDARIELGGRPPNDDCCVYHEAVSARVVLVFDTPPIDCEGILQRLTTACVNFSTTLAEAESELAERIGPHSSAPNSESARALERELAALAERAGAVEGAVWDLKSPVMWAQVLAHSEPLPSPSVPAPAPPELVADPVIGPASGEATSDEPAAPEAHFLRSVPKQGPTTWLERLRDEDEVIRASRGIVTLSALGSLTMSKLFNGIYVVSLRFDVAPTEPRASGALLHALPALERLVEALPPIEPPPRGRVLRFTRPLRPV